MKKSTKGDWVQLHTTVLQGEERPSHERDTVPLEMWINGFLLDDGARIGDLVHVETMIGRKVEGILCEQNPAYRHSFGETVPELLLIGKKLRELAREVSDGS